MCSSSDASPQGNPLLTLLTRFLTVYPKLILGLSVSVGSICGGCNSKEILQRNAERGTRSEEPIVYVNGNPYCLRLENFSLRNMRVRYSVNSD